MPATATRKRPKKERETPDYAQFAERIIRGLARRTAAGDLDGLTALAELQRSLDGHLADAVAGLRSEAGGAYAWSDIGQALGVTRQAAQLRFPKAGGARKGGAQPAHLR